MRRTRVHLYSLIHSLQKRYFASVCAVMLMQHMSVCALNWKSIQGAFKKTTQVFDDAFHETKKAAEKVASTVADRFKDTKTTRAADYAIRLAALEVAESSARRILSAAEAITSGTLNVSIDTMQAGITAGDAFLAGVVQKAAPEVLEQSALSGSTFLESIKIAGVASLDATEWVAQNILGQFDLNEIEYKGSLRSLEHGVLGNVHVKGILLGTSFDETTTLDPQKIKDSFISVAEKLAVKIRKAIYDPLLIKATGEVHTLERVRKEGEIALSQSPPPAISKVGPEFKTLSTALQEYATVVEESNAILSKAALELEQKLQALAHSTTEQLKANITNNQKETTETRILSRQELARRALASPQ